ncbi:iron ABC transporter permease [Polaromonas sp.]|uniref:ABC transporter permease n=1 Tax=Polaromonas sp. TaxID=1869339 RepID=UPI0027319F72|nr:iron ABC transporter permease [Polaromonas sp.]MDP1886154.1 iron ABC transporter permease [Polaromonas sp.]
MLGAAGRGVLLVLWRVVLVLLALILLLPVLAVLGSMLQWNADSAQILQEISRTVLPEYAWTSLILCIIVACGVAVVGVTSAAAVTLFDFAGRKTFEWALLLPLAMPAYVVAYAYTDFLQYSGPMQTWVRAMSGVEGRVFPEVRSVGGAAWVFTFCLYPYVYLLARTALMDRATHLMDAARLLGAPMSRRIREVALPLARPAVAAGVALALMETLADFGVSSYFGIQTFTAGIYKAWLVMDNRVAAAQLSTVLLVVVMVLLTLERRAQKRMRFAVTKGAGTSAATVHATSATQSGRSGRSDHSNLTAPRLAGKRLVLAWLVCGLPVLMGFVLPLLFMLRPFLASLRADETVFPWSQFAQWAANSVMLGGISAVLAVALALLLAFAVRMRPDPLTRGVAQLAGVGYAIPGAVIVVGLLLPVGWLQAAAPTLGVGYWVTATALGIVWAYVVRFSGVALQSVQSGYAKIPTSFDDSARMLNVSGFNLMRRVHAPLLKRSTAAAVLLVFVDVMKELPATLVLRPFNSDTLAVVAYQLARDERLGEAALPSLALVLVGLLPVMLLSRTLRSR